MLGIPIMFPYYGGKWLLAPRYPEPQQHSIIEPFAGGAGYSLRYPDRDVWLIDADPTIAALWSYLISVSESEILSLPLYDGRWETTDELKIPDEAKWLIGWWCNQGTPSPRKRPSSWAKSRPKSHWGENIRTRIASNLQYIRHWHVLCADYARSPDIRATWFIDPPYSNRAGRYYRVRFDPAAYPKLGEWALTRKGQVVVCENYGASWLPFEPFYCGRARRKGDKRDHISAEVVFHRGITNETFLP